MGERYLVGVDIGGTNLKVGVVTPAGEVEAHTSRPTRLGAGWPGVVDQVVETVAMLLSQAGLSLSAVAGVGVGVPGTVRLPQGEVLFSPNLGWKEVPFLTALKDRFSVPVTIDNDAHVAALGEYWRGAAQGRDSVLMLTLGTGVGTAFLWQGKVFRGRAGLGCEMGHMVIDPAGPLCGCGNRGCLEALAAAPAVERLARQLVARGLPTQLGAEGDWGAAEVFAAAAAGDEVGRTVVEEVTRHLAAGLANAVVLIDPEVIVLGGGMSASADLFLPGLREELARRVGRMAYPAPAVVPAALGSLAGILGAAYLVRLVRGEAGEAE